MTHTEDIKRLTIMNEDYQEYLHNRIAALESRVQFLKEQLELSKQSNLKQQKNEQRQIN